jgi:vacuolar-type H+-ATPase subunit F/Vma7
MSTVAAIGATHEFEGFALIGVSVITATDESQVLDAWRRLDDEVGLVILSRDAVGILRPMLADRPHTLTVVMP